MKKCIYLSVVLASVLSAFTLKATSDERNPFFDNVPAFAQSSGFSLAMADDIPSIMALSSKPGVACVKEWCEGKLNRFETRSAFGLLILKGSDQKICAAIGCGRMPTLGYDSDKHQDIIQTWMELGITEQIEEGEDFSSKNIQRIGNRGLGCAHIIFKEGCDDRTRKAVYQGLVSYYTVCSEVRFKLPKEGTDPIAVITLLPPGDPSVKAAQSAGFNPIQKAGFDQFYGEPRVMFYKDLEDSES